MSLNPSTSHLRSVIAVAFVLLTAGCAISPLAKRASNFGAAASVIARDSSDAYSTVEDAAYSAQVSSLILDFDKTGFDPDKVKPFLSEEDLEARRALLSGLRRYADLLQDVAGNRPIDQLNTEVVGLGQSLKTLTSNPALQKIGTVSGPELKGLTTAIDALGQFLIERKRNRALPAILNKMQDLVEKICALLDADLGKRPNSDGIGGRGLRGQLWIEYDRMISNQKTFVLNNKARLSPQEKAAGIALLPQLVRQQRAADHALAAIQTALVDLPKTHRALLTSPPKDPAFAARLAELTDDALRIASFYKGLNFK